MRIVQQPSSGGRVAGARRNGGLILTLVLELNPSVRLRHRNQETSHPRTLPLSSGANTSKVALTLSMPSSQARLVCCQINMSPLNQRVTSKALMPSVSDIRQKAFEEPCESSTTQKKYVRLNSF